MIHLIFTPKTEQDSALFQALIDSLDYPYHATPRFGSFYFYVEDETEADNIESETASDERMREVEGYWEIED